ncbi:MAG TPA: hypothetical protein VHX13_05485 [Acidobacteriaceae bacterium]|jgi:hypothetical protein|nr:hypothetical protein [Acidobacteriaceae bacterium]
MPSPPTNPVAPRDRRRTPGDPLARLRPERARLSQALAIAVSTLAVCGALIAIPVIRALAPAVLQIVAPVVVRAVVRLPAHPAAPPPKTTACTHNHMQAGPSHRHICS